MLQFAVEVLKIEHIIVCGHFGCGGVHAACSSRQYGLIDNWLRNIKDIYNVNRAELDAIYDPVSRADRLCELNVIEQVRNVGHTTIVQNACASGHALSVHGLIYSLKDGLLRDLAVRINNPEALEAIYRTHAREREVDGVLKKTNRHDPPRSPHDTLCERHTLEHAAVDRRLRETAEPGPSGKARTQASRCRTA